MKNIIFTIGDYNGIGPEIILKTLIETDLSKHLFSFCGSLRIMQECAFKLKLSLPSINLLDKNKFQPLSGCLNVFDIVR